MNITADDIITAPISEFCRISGLGRTKVYGLMDGGRLQSVKIGKRRLIVLDSWRRMIEEQLAAKEEAAARHNPRSRGRPRSTEAGEKRERAL
jgi:hypothetical protein